MKVLAIISLLAVMFGASAMQADRLWQEPPMKEMVLEIREVPAAEKSVALLTKQGLRQVPLSEYLTCVVLSEMPASFPEEALKAQAVAARTFTERTLSGDKHGGGMICAQSDCCQAYADKEALKEKFGEEFSSYWEKAASAVRKTEGEVLTYDGSLIEAVYFSCSGGKSEDAVAVWGTEVPYLRSVLSPGEEEAPRYRTEAAVPLAEVKEMLLSARPTLSLPDDPAAWFGKTEHSDGGGVESLQIGSEGFTGTELRKLFALPSACFTVTISGENAVFSCLGYGHRVGMSQWGAKAMADAGKDYREILQHYYSGVSIEKPPRENTRRLA